MIPEDEQAKFDALSPAFSQLYLAINGVLSAVICISDPLREEARDVLSALQDLGVKNAVMLTGDSPRTAAAIAEQLGVDDFQAGVLPSDKADYVAALRREGHTVLMWGMASTTPRLSPRRTQALPSATGQPLPGRSPTSPSPPTAYGNWCACANWLWP